MRTIKTLTSLIILATSCTNSIKDTNSQKTSKPQSKDTDQNQEKHSFVLRDKDGQKVPGTWLYKASERADLEDQSVHLIKHSNFNTGDLTYSLTTGEIKTNCEIIYIDNQCNQETYSTKAPPCFADGEIYQSTSNPVDTKPVQQTHWRLNQGKCTPFEWSKKKYKTKQTKNHPLKTLLNNPPYTINLEHTP